MRECHRVTYCHRVTTQLQLINIIIIYNYYPLKVPKFNIVLGPELFQTSPVNFHTYYCFGRKIT